MYEMLEVTNRDTHRLLQHMVRNTARSNDRPVLNCIQIDEQNMIALDGFKMVITRRFPLGVIHRGEETVSFPEPGQTGHWEFKYVGKLDRTWFWALFQSDATYPDAYHVIEEIAKGGMPKFQISFSRNMLIDLLEMIDIKEGDFALSGAVFSFSSPAAPIEVTYGTELHQVYNIMMPMMYGTTDRDGKVVMELPPRPTRPVPW